MRRFLSLLLTFSILLSPWSDYIARAACGAMSTSPATRRPILNQTPPLPMVGWSFKANLSLPPWASVVRASAGTDGLITDAAGSSYNTYVANTPIYYNGRGIGVWNTRTQFLLNSAAPVTQTTGSLTTGTYQFWCIGSGNVTTSLGTATATATVPSVGSAKTCSDGTSQVISVTVAGTLTFTVAGSVDRFQLEKGAYPTPFILSTGTTFVRSIEYINVTGVPLSIMEGPSGTFAIGISFLQAGGQVLSSNTSTNVALAYNNGTTLYTNNASAQQLAASLPAGNTLIATTNGRWAVSFSTYGRSICGYGGAVVSDLNSFATITAFGTPSGLAPDGYITSMYFWPVRLSSPELRNISAPGALQ